MKNLYLWPISWAVVKMLKKPPVSSTIEYLFESQIWPIKEYPLTVALLEGSKLVSSDHKSLLSIFDYNNLIN